MAALTMRCAVVLLLGVLAACRQTSSADGGDPTIAHAANSTSSVTAGALQSRSSGAGTSGTGNTPAAPTPSTPGVSAPVALDANQRREYADVYVDQKDPSGQKGLVSYLMKPEEWYIEKVVQINPTLKHWRFWRVARTDGKSMPEVDPLRPRR